MAEPKDFWDKADIVLRAIVPIAVGLMILAWNSQRTTQQTAAAMTEIAIGILAENPVEGSNALRHWAIQVLRDPGNPEKLSDEAAKQLEFEALPLFLSMRDAFAEKFKETDPSESRIER